MLIDFGAQEFALDHFPLVERCNDPIFQVGGPKRSKSVSTQHLHPRIPSLTEKECTSQARSNERWLVVIILADIEYCIHWDVVRHSFERPLARIGIVFESHGVIVIDTRSPCEFPVCVLTLEPDIVIRA